MTPENHFDDNEMTEQEELDFLKEHVGAPADETKNVAFLRLVNKRLPVAVKRIRLLANLSNPQNYAHTPEQAAAMLDILKAEVAKLEDAFRDDSTSNNVPLIE